MMISDASDSESDVSSDSEAENLASQAYKFIKPTFDRPKKDGRGTRPSVTNSKDSLISHRRKIYDTFVNNSDDEADELSQHLSVNERIEENDKNVFFLDKNPLDMSNASCVSNTLSADADSCIDYKLDTEDLTEVEVTDLSNIDIISDANHELSLEASKVPKKKLPGSKSQPEELSTSLKSGINCGDIYVNVDPYKNPQKQKKIVPDKASKELEVMKKCVVPDDFEKQDSISPIESIRMKKKQRKLEREKTKGDKWFHMAAPEITEERKHDLEVLQMRKVLDPKRFYKSSDIKATPKYFQFGRVVETPADFYSSRIPKKQRKSTMVEELLADAEFRQFNKRKYEEIQEMKRMGKGPYQRMKRLRKKKKQT